ncbi:hypothetical protein LLEC1_05694 [Akanthomyces lecanii]|uniref:Uncharacterized protein n=1 Tax=Cordyceps confragosa TaxID=2714763 RepID=A0A179I7Y3_CORDF|nr:hypothetical protein LLEC1_05694 [Akanthomyces lecanii]
MHATHVTIAVPNYLQQTKAQHPPCSSLPVALPCHELHRVLVFTTIPLTCVRAAVSWPTQVAVSVTPQIGAHLLVYISAADCASTTRATLLRTLEYTLYLAERTGRSMRDSAQPDSQLP